MKERKTHGPKIGLVLSSGGLKPVSSVGLFEFLDEEAIDIDLIVGCSGGGIMAAFRATGMDSDQIIATTKNFLQQKPFGQINYRTLLNIGGLPYGKFDLNSGLLKREIGLDISRKTYGDQLLEELPVPLVLQTTDIQTGEGYVLESGLLANAVYATSAMYPLLPPMKLHDRWLVDGAFSSPLPVLEAVKRGMDIIIVMLFHENLTTQPQRFMEGLYNITRAFSSSLIKSQLSLAIDLHHYEIIVINVPFLKPVSMSDPRQVEQLVDMGRRAVDGKRQEILDAIKTYRV